MATATKGRLRRTQSAITLTGSKPKGRSVAAHPRKVLSKADKRTPEGRFAVRLQSLLDERGWSPVYFADCIGVDPPAVRRWLRADGLPGNIDLVKRIGKALDTPGHPFPDWRQVLPIDL